MSSMEIVLRVDGVDPPQGTATLGWDSGAGETAFVGWLGLLRALADVLSRATEDAGAEQEFSPNRPPNLR